MSRALSALAGLAWLCLAAPALAQDPAPAPDAAPAPAAEPTPHPPAKVTIGWNGLHVHDATERFGLELHLMVQARGSVAIDGEGPPAADLALLRARPMLRFFAWNRRLVATFQPELVGGARVLDARVDVTLVPGFELTGGQFIVPFTRGWASPLPLVSTAERSLNNAVFAPGRRAGAMVHGLPLDGKVELWAGGFDPDDPTNPRPGVHAPLSLARVQVNPLGRAPATELPSLDGPAPTRVSVGVAALAEPVIDPDGAPDLLRVTSTVDASVQARGFTSYAEGFLRWTAEQPLGWGASWTVGQFLVPRRLQLLGRLTAIDTEVGDEVDARLTVEPMLGVYLHGAHARIDLRYAVSQGADLPIGHLLAVQTQLMF